MVFYMATTSAFSDIFNRLLGIPVSTSMTYLQRLREDETVFRRGKQGAGALEPTTTEIANWLIALCATPSTGRKAPDALATVRIVRSAPRLVDMYVPPGASYTHHANGLAIEAAQNFGEAVDALIDDMRSGRYAEWLGSDIDAASSIRFFDHGGRVFVSLRARQPESFLVFRNDDVFGPPGLTYTTELNIFVLQRIAEAMGQIPTT
jgi:hypothetical protein